MQNKVIACLMLSGCVIGTQDAVKRQTSFVQEAKLSGTIACRAAEQDELSPFADHETRARRAEYRSLLLGGHCIERGANTVIHLSEFFPGQPDTPDVATFQQITIELPHTASLGSDVLLDASRLPIYVSGGGSVWVEQGAGHFGREARGTLRLTRRSETKMVLTGEIEVELKHAKSWTPPQVVMIRINDEFVETDIASLRRCLGFGPICPSARFAPAR